DLSSEERKGVNTHLDYDLAGKRPTSRRKKKVVSEVDFLKVFAFHYTEDPAGYENERQRAQFAVLFLVHTFSAARPCSTTNEITRKTRGLAVRASAGHADGLAAADGASSSKRSHAGVMIAGNQERVFDDSIARAVNYEDVGLVLVRNRQSATAASMPVQFAMEVARQLLSATKSSSGLTFENHYLDPIVGLDVQNALLRKPTEDAAMHTLTHTDVVIDRGVPNTVPREIAAEIEDLPDMRKLLATRRKLRDGAATEDTDLSSDDADEELERQLVDIGSESAHCRLGVMHEL
ncbi:hypothetical protein LTR53_014418, partial [Teratosphaeriaceae sp. CCFEE 6253]